VVIGSVGFALAAGVLSSLSPCVVPILPIVLGAAVAEHRWAPAALASGLALSFTAVGLFIATVGFSLGLDTASLRFAGAVVLVGFGLVMLVPRLQEGFAVAAGRFSAWAGQGSSAYAARGLGGQFFLGGLLGAVWSPCVGPTLGAASLMAAQGRDLVQVSIVMLAFGLGAAMPLLLLGLVSREAISRWRTRLLRAGRQGKAALGAVAGGAGMLMLTGLDKPLEAVLVAATPEWLAQLTTRF
jgi:cytochrome c-type biogenesis protein